MLWMVVLDDGRYFTVEASCLMAVSMDLRDRGLIPSDLDIVCVTRMVNKMRSSKIFQIWKILESARAEKI